MRTPLSALRLVGLPVFLLGAAWEALVYQPWWRGRYAAADRVAWLYRRIYRRDGG